MVKPVALAHLGIWLGVWGVSAVAVAQVPPPEGGYGPGYGPFSGPRAWADRVAPPAAGRRAEMPGSGYGPPREPVWAPPAGRGYGPWGRGPGYPAPERTGVYPYRSDPGYPAYPGYPGSEAWPPPPDWEVEPMPPAPAGRGQWPAAPVPPALAPEPAAASGLPAGEGSAVIPRADLRPPAPPAPPAEAVVPVPGAVPPAATLTRPVPAPAVPAAPVAPPSAPAAPAPPVPLSTWMVSPTPPSGPSGPADAEVPSVLDLMPAAAGTPTEAGQPAAGSAGEDKAGGAQGQSRSGLLERWMNPLRRYW